MTEAEWLACERPHWLLNHLYPWKSRARKFRLYVCASCRWPQGFFQFLKDPCWVLLDVAERYADGLVGVQEYKAAMRAVSTMTRRETEAGGGFPDGPLLFGQKLLDFLRLKHLPGWEGLQPRVEGFSFVSDEQKRNREAQRSRGIGVITEEQALEFQNINDAFSKAHTNFLRCIFGNPFRPVSLNPSWVTPTVTNLAEAAYQHRDLPSGELNTARLAILADALEEAGCDNQEILGHLRSPGPHFLGCHVLDLLLGKE